MKYKRRSLVIDAFQWFGEEKQINYPEWVIQLIKDGKIVIVNEGQGNIYLRLEPISRRLCTEFCFQGNYLCKHGDGVVDSLDADHFKELYEEKKAP